jgi:hypothetical protein
MMAESSHIEDDAEVREGLIVKHRHVSIGYANAAEEIAQLTHKIGPAPATFGLKTSWATT